MFLAKERKIDLVVSGERSFPVASWMSLSAMLAKACFPKMEGSAYSLVNAAGNPPKTICLLMACRSNGETAPMFCSGLANREAKETSQFDKCDSAKERVDIVTL